METVEVSPEVVTTPPAPAEALTPPPNDKLAELPIETGASQPPPDASIIAADNGQPTSPPDTTPDFASLFRQKIKNFTPDEMAQLLEEWRKKDAAKEPQETEKSPAEIQAEINTAWNGCSRLVLEAEGEGRWADNSTIISAIQQFKTLRDTPDEFIETIKKSSLFKILPTPAQLAENQHAQPVTINYTQVSEVFLQALRELAQETDPNDASKPTELAKQAQTSLVVLEKYHNEENGGFEPLSDEQRIRRELKRLEPEVFETGVETLDAMLEHIGGLPTKMVTGEKIIREVLDWEAIRQFDPNSATGMLQFLLVTYHDVAEGIVKLKDQGTARQMLSGLIVQELGSLQTDALHQQNPDLAQKLFNMKGDKFMRTLQEVGLEALRQRVKNIAGKVYGQELQRSPLQDKFMLRDLLLAYACRGKDVINVVRTNTGVSITFKNQDAEKFITDLLKSGRGNVAEMDTIKVLAANEGQLVGQLLFEELGVNVAMLESDNPYEQFAQQAITLIQDQRSARGIPPLTTEEITKRQTLLTDLAGGDLRRFKEKRKFPLSGGSILLLGLVFGQFLPLIMKDDSVDVERR